MDPVKSNLAEIIAGNHRITVPMYQRKYEWEKEKICAFWDDLIRLTQPEEKNTLHYMGTMVRHDEAPGHNGLNQFMVIDGQQRITTAMLLIHAIREFLKSKNFDLNSSDVKTLLDQRVLDYQGEEGRDRLHIRELLNGSYFSKKSNGTSVKKFIPTEFDHESYFGLVYEGKPLKRVRHYKHSKELKERIDAAAEGLSTHAERAVFVHSLFDSLVRMNLVYIVLNVSDRPQQIFESINYRGMPLSVTDLIRNHVLRVADEGVRLKVFNQIWKPMQSELQRDDENDGPDLFDGFFRAYVAMVDDVASDAEMFKRFTANYPRRDGEPESDLLKRLKPICDYASVYRILANPTKTEKETELGRALYHFSRLNFITPLSILMRFYRCEAPHPKAEYIIEALSVLESYHVRRALLNKPVKRMAEMFSRISRDYDRLDKKGERIEDERFPKWLIERIDHYATTEFTMLGRITDESLRAKAAVEDVYVNSRTATKYVLVEREIELSKDSTKDIVGCEIEHVLPQSFEERWIPDLRKWFLDPDGKNQPDETVIALADYRVHHFGNLTLVSSGGNKTLGNKKFNDKKTEETFGYKESNYKTTRADFSNLDTWSDVQIDARSKDIFEFIIRRFSYTPGWNLKLAVK